MSKISGQFIGYEPGPAIASAVAEMKKKRAFAWKAVNRHDIAADLAASIPGSLGVYRDQAWQDTVFQPGLRERLVASVNAPYAEARAWMEHHRPIFQSLPPSVAIEILNEFAGWDWDAAAGRWVIYPGVVKATAKFEAYVIKMLFDEGRVAVSGNWSVMSPPYEVAPLITEHLEMAEICRSFVGWHLYNSPNLWTTHGTDARPEDSVFRWHEWWTRANCYALYPHVRHLGTEFEWDEIGGNGLRGWKKVQGLTAPLAAKQMYEYADPVFNAHSSFVAAFFYRLGHDNKNADSDPQFAFSAIDYASPPRTDFDLVSHILSHVSSVGDVPPIPVPEPPTPPVEEPPTKRDYVVVGLNGVNIRSTPSTANNATIVGSMPKDFPFQATPYNLNWVIIERNRSKFYVARHFAGKPLIQEGS